MAETPPLAICPSQYKKTQEHMFDFLIKQKKIFFNKTQNFFDSDGIVSCELRHEQVVIESKIY